jgi:hypothetical protein
VAGENGRFCEKLFKHGWTSSFGECPTITATTYVVLKKKNVQKINRNYEINNISEDNT